MIPSRRPLTLVAAVARNAVIGARGRMPWRLPGDLKEFRRLTTGHALLMGRVTYASIGSPLPDRLITVVSSRPGPVTPGVEFASTLEAALACADRQAERLGTDAIMVAGGGAIYAATIGWAATLLITAVELDPAGDTAFPAIDGAIWRKTEDRPARPMPGDSAPYRFTRWERRAEARPNCG